MRDLRETIERLEERTKKVRLNRQGLAKLKRQVEKDRGRRNRKRGKVKRAQKWAMSGRYTEQVDLAGKQAYMGAEGLSNEEIPGWKFSKAVANWFSQYTVQTLKKIGKELQAIPEVEGVWLNSEWIKGGEDLQVSMSVDVAPGASNAEGRIKSAININPKHLKGGPFPVPGGPSTPRGVDGVGVEPEIGVTEPHVSSWDADDDDWGQSSVVLQLDFYCHVYKD